MRGLDFYMEAARDLGSHIPVVPKAVLVLRLYPYH